MDTAQDLVIKQPSWNSGASWRTSAGGHSSAEVGSVCTGSVHRERKLCTKFDLGECLRAANSWNNLKIHVIFMLLF